jgi:hypothetical protein
MSLLCFIQGHAPAAATIWNRGYSFTRCTRCDCHLLRAEGDWQTVPRGHRIVWKEGHHQHSRPAGYPRTLPALQRDVRGGVPGAWLGAWYRHFLIRTGFAKAEIGSPAEAAEAREAEQAMRVLPAPVAFVAVLASGLEALLPKKVRRGA